MSFFRQARAPTRFQDALQAKRFKQSQITPKLLAPRIPMGALAQAAFGAQADVF